MSIDHGDSIERKEQGLSSSQLNLDLITLMKSRTPQESRKLDDGPNLGLPLYNLIAFAADEPKEAAAKVPATGKAKGSITDSTAISRPDSVDTTAKPKKTDDGSQQLEIVDTAAQFRADEWQRSRQSFENSELDNPPAIPINPLKSITGRISISQVAPTTVKAAIVADAYTAHSVLPELGWAGAPAVVEAEAPSAHRAGKVSPKEKTSERLHERSSTGKTAGAVGAISTILGFFQIFHDDE
jgi:hypothetical protein